MKNDELLIYSKKPEMLEQLQMIVDFIDDKTNVSEFLQLVDIHEDEKGKIDEISFEELKTLPQYKHEKSHIDVWEKYGIEFVIGWDKRNSYVGVVPKNFKEKYGNSSKESVLEIYKEVCFAPYKNGERRGTSSDLVSYEALCGNISTTTKLEDVIKLFHTKYNLETDYLFFSLV